ncbi:MAG: substrate-binding domain-containing protein [Anaerolineales bacterium]|jgi:phosphate transport system substrate-binding protein|nr:substrate-binding domain-containing protein [Anaerolineales bacterium]MCC7512696.1 substrate-binding domain-containing protein [Anaerolineae bacterium]GER77984.1 phosphate ABC transporter substrate-binding protein [Candidatus Denitrolinea symbiosum]MCZ2290130.1 substrate-binding domain-containing protein [Anaerolineales bacterium]MCZ7548645.1 substrate-binding domain-containing protein [Anaerolineales bacterium]
MRKLTLCLFSLLTIASLALGACGPAGGSASSSGPEAGASDPGALSGTISVSGAFALYPMMTVWAEEFSRLHPGVQFDVQGGGAGKGMTDAIAGAVDIGMISRSIKPEEEAQGIFWVSVTKDAVFPIISEKNPVADGVMAKGITQEVFNKIYVTGEITTWGQVIGDPSVTDEIHVFTRSDAAGAAEQWAKYSGGKAQEDLLGVGVNGEPPMVDTVMKDPLGIGYGNLNSIFDLSGGGLVPGILIPPIDINGNGQADADETYTVKEDAFGAVATGKYPSPPARFENLATKGKPTGLVLAFIQWILTDGQQYLEAAGYVPLTAEQQAESLAKLK